MFINIPKLLPNRRGIASSKIWRLSSKNIPIAAGHLASLNNSPQFRQHVSAYKFLSLMYNLPAIILIIKIKESLRW